MSSCELKDYSLVRCAGEAIGLRGTLKEMQLAYSTWLWTDASAARGLALRTGGGQIKHMQAKYYWLQGCVKANVLTEEKIRGAVSPADLMTKHLNGAMMRDMCGSLDLKFEAGRAATAPKLEVDSGYVTRCAKLLAVVSLLPRANGAQTESHQEGYNVIAWAATLNMMIGLLWLVCARPSNSVGIKTRENAKPTADIDDETCEFYWTERGARLHSRRDCVQLRRAEAVSTGALCKVCFNAQPGPW